MTPTQGEHAQTALAHELFAAAQLAPGEGIEDAVRRIAAALTAPGAQAFPHTWKDDLYAEMQHRFELRRAEDDFLPIDDTQLGVEFVMSWLEKRLAAPAQPAAPQGAAYAEPAEFPAGAIVNGRTHIDRLESFYRFDCEAGPLINCDDWHGLKRCFEHLAERASNGQAPAGAASGLPTAQEPKYTVTGTHIVNRVTGEAVPHDEPVFVFRARDALGVRALEAYLALIGEREPSSEHANAVRGRIADFQRFAASHPARMKWPDSTAQAAPAADYDHGPQSVTVAEAARHVGKWLNERPNRPLDLRDVAMLCAHAQKAPAAGAVDGMPPGISALMCVISSLRDTAHFSDEEGELTDELRTLRDWAMTQATAPTPAAQADSVLEDAARWQFVELAPSAITLRLHNLRPDQREQYVDAARKQGAKHDNH